MEVIARRKGGLVALYTVVLLVCALLFGIGAWATATAEDTVPFLVGLQIFFGLLLVGICLWVIIGYIRTPEVAVCYEGGNLHFAGKYTCSPSEVTSVNYKRATARGITYRWGKLYVTAGGRTYTYNYIADVEYAHDCILQLMLEARKKG